MSPLRRWAILPVLAAVGLALSLWTGSDVVAALAAGGAVLAAGAFLLLVVQDRVRWGFTAPSRPEGDTLALLGRSFREGAFGRRTILARLASLDWQLPHDPAERAAEEAEMLRAPEPRFLEYVERRVAEVERRT